MTEPQRQDNKWTLEEFIVELLKKDYVYVDKVAYFMEDDGNAVDSIAEDIRLILQGKDPKFTWRTL